MRFLCSKYFLFPDTLRDTNDAVVASAAAEVGREPVAVGVPGGGGQPPTRLLLHLRVLGHRYGQKGNVMNINSLIDFYINFNKHILRSATRVFGTRRRRCWTCWSGRASGGRTGAAARPSAAAQKRPETCEYYTLIQHVILLTKFLVLCSCNALVHLRTLHFGNYGFDS